MIIIGNYKKVLTVVVHVANATFGMKETLWPSTLAIEKNLRMFDLAPFENLLDALIAEALVATVLSTTNEPLIDDLVFECFVK